MRNFFRWLHKHHNYIVGFNSCQYDLMGHPRMLIYANCGRDIYLADVSSPYTKEPYLFSYIIRKGIQRGAIYA